MNDAPHTLRAGVQMGVLSAPLPRGERGVGQSPTVLTSPWGRVSRGYSVPKALILLGFLRLGIYANRRAVLRAGYALMPHLCTCSHVHKCSRIRGSVCPLLRCLRTARRSSNGLSYLTSFRWSVKASLWPLAEPSNRSWGLACMSG